MTERKQSQAQLDNLKPGTFARDRELAKKANKKSHEAKKRNSLFRAQFIDFLKSDASKLYGNKNKLFKKMKQAFPGQVVTIKMLLSAEWVASTLNSKNAHALGDLVKWATEQESGKLVEKKEIKSDVSDAIIAAMSESEAENGS